ncbi:MAG: DUF4147 domain-containing protein [Pseudomonadota bacterium]
MTAPPGIADAPRLLRRLFDVAVAAAGPEGRITPPHEPSGAVVTLGAGKAAARMAAAFVEATRKAGWRAAPRGVVSVPRGYGWSTPAGIEVMEAGHPAPDTASVEAANRALAAAHAARAEDLVVFLISGGASAAMCAPARDPGGAWGVSLAQKRALTAELLRSGAPIDAINRVRQAVSAIKGGRLAAAAAPARVVTYAISDVPGDDPRLIGSGPTLAALEAGPDAALSICARYGVSVSAAMRETIERNACPEIVEGPCHVIVRPADALAAAAVEARAMGFTPVILSDALEGEARELGATLAARTAREAAADVGPLALISGGEATVRVRGAGRGGPNAECALAFALALEPALRARVAAIACDTDGRDGVLGAAGAWVGPETLAALAKAGVDARAALDNNDAYGIFAAVGGLVETEPTRTNVNDFRCILIW